MIAASERYTCAGWILNRVDHSTGPSPIYIYIYIYIYIVINRQTVSFYQNSSVWLHT